ncbi:MAG: hypothetical protein HOD72_01650, partial [Opitutae bacterium]|nr:hypothetical protein [Opitutae bacterium]
MKVSLSILLITLLGVLLVLPLANAADDKLFAAFAEANCMDCHDADVAEGGLNFEALSADLDDEDVRRHWIRVFDRVRLHEMPPKKKKQPEPAARRKFLDSLENALHEASYKSQREGRVTLRRLNRAEYENT